MENNFKNTEPVEFVLNDFTKGYAQCIDNNWNYAAYAQDPGVSIYQNEYNAGYVLGKVQGNAAIKAARNNTWKCTMLESTFGHPVVTDQIPDGGLDLARKALVDNYNYLCDWVDKTKSDEKTRGIMRLMYRMLGIYDGAVDHTPRTDVKYNDLLLSSMPADDSQLHTGDDQLTFLDIYFVNAQMDLFDAIANDLGAKINDVEEHDKAHTLEYKPQRCSGFVKMLPDGEILWTHTSWCCFLAQSCAVTFVVGDDFLTQNCYCQGQFGSNTDFGFNGHGIGFNETTETYFYNESKTIGIWLTWRAAAAEHFATSIEEFYDYCNIDNTGTYLNGYMVVDVYRNKIALIDMSYARIALLEGDGQTLTLKDSTGYEPTFLDYDHHMVSPTHILGCNIPVYKRIWRELQTIDGAPKRRFQLFRNLDTVTDIPSAQHLVTYNQDEEPISVAGRWDYGFGTSEFMRPRAHGAVDGKAFGSNEVKEVLKNLSMKPSINGAKTSFWMKFGTPYINGTPFIWSQSIFHMFKEADEKDYVPDVLDGRWNRVKMFME